MGHVGLDSSRAGMRCRAGWQISKQAGQAWPGLAKSAPGLATASKQADTSSREQMCDI